MNTIICRRGLIIGLLATAVALATWIETSFGAKPAPPPPLPPIRYRIQYWTIPNADPTTASLNGMNNLGQIVGWYYNLAGSRRGYLYDPLSIDSHVAVDLETHVGGAGVPSGWRISGALGINDDGIIVGSVSPSEDADATVRQGFVLDTQAAVPQVVLLPNWGAWSYTYARQINDNGDILGVYENPDDSTGLYFYNPNDPNSPYFLDDVQTNGLLNNPTATRPAQVGGTFDNGTQAPFRWTPQSNTLETFGTLTTVGGVRGMNDAGTLCGSTRSGKPSTIYPMRVNLPPAQLLSNIYGPWGQDINSTGDVLLASAGTKSGGLYRDDWPAYGNSVDVNKLVTGTQAELATWASASSTALYLINDRISGINAGEIAGYLRFTDGTNARFLLVPVAAP
jgi:uncharacterized membrane protein